MFYTFSLNYFHSFVKLLVINNKLKNINIMADFEIKDGVVIIPEGTEHIDLDGLNDLKGLTTIVIPKSVVKIDKHLFSWYNLVCKRCEAEY